MDEAPRMTSKEEDGEESERPLIRCLKATRWVVVSLVLLVAAAAIARALVVAFRPIDLNVMLACGTVGMNGTSPSNMSANFIIGLCNPSGRDGLRYANITFTLFGNSAVQSEGQPIVSFPAPSDTWVGKKLMVDVFVEVGEIDLPPQFAGLYNRTTSSSSGMVKIQGLLQRRITGLEYTRGYNVTYYCWPVTIGHKIAADAGDVFCSVRYPGQAAPQAPICAGRHRKQCPAT